MPTPRFAIAPPIEPMLAKLAAEQDAAGGAGPRIAITAALGRPMSSGALTGDRSGNGAAADIATGDRQW
jgi:hypothetical protein